MSQSSVPELEPVITQGYAVSNGIRMHYAECGAENQELVLLLHGFPEFWYSWRNQLPVLGRRYHVVAPDMRGFNLTDKPERIEDYRLEVVAKDVVGLIDHFRASKATIIGHDWGGGVAWAVAQAYPDRVSKLVVMQVPPAAAWRANLTLKQLMRSWYMFFFQLPKIPEWAIRRADYKSIDRTFGQMVVKKDAFSSTDVKLYKEAMRQPGAVSGSINYYRANVGRLMSRSGSPARVAQAQPRFAMPVLFIFAEQDFAILPETAKGVANYVSGPYKELRIPNSGHWVQNEAAEEVNKALLEFLESASL